MKRHIYTSNWINRFAYTYTYIPWDQYWSEQRGGGWIQGLSGYFSTFRCRVWPRRPVALLPLLRSISALDSSSLKLGKISAFASAPQLMVSIESILLIIGEERIVYSESCRDRKEPFRGRFGNMRMARSVVPKEELLCLHVKNFGRFSLLRFFFSCLVNFLKKISGYNFFHF